MHVSDAWLLQALRKLVRGTDGAAPTRAVTPRRLKRLEE